MKIFKIIFAVIALGIAGLGNAWADHHGHFGVGVVIGPTWGPWYYPYPPPYYYRPYDPVVVVQQPAPVYVEQPQVPASPPPATAPVPTNYWYYCPTTKGYYPYVKECSVGWQRVQAAPPGTN